MGQKEAFEIAANPIKRLISQYRDELEVLIQLRGKEERCKNEGYGYRIIVIDDTITLMNRIIKDLTDIMDE